MNPQETQRDIGNNRDHLPFQAIQELFEPNLVTVHVDLEVMYFVLHHYYLVYQGQKSSTAVRHLLSHKLHLLFVTEEDQRQEYRRHRDKDDRE